MSHRHRNLTRLLLCLSLALFAQIASAQQTNAPVIHFIWMGGNDCPPCMYWRANELPKLEAMEEFKKIRFSYIAKTIYSPVPSSMFLPDEVKPYKDALDAANGGRTGSPQWAVLVNGQVIDYQWGARTANDFRQAFAAIQTDGTYPTARCEQREKGKKCLKSAKAGAKLPAAVLDRSAPRSS